MADLEQFDALAADPGQTAYYDQATGKVVFAPRTEDPTLLAQYAEQGLRQATAEDIERRRSFVQHSTTPEQIEAAAKLGANVATLGLAGFNGAEDKAQIAAFREASPTLAATTEIAGAIAPGAAGGALGAGAMSALGLGSRAAAIGTLVGEEVAQSAAIERQHADEESRGIELVNVVSGLPLAFGVSAAARAARGVARLGEGVGARLLGKVEQEGLDMAGERAADTLSQGAKTSRARRSVGAAGGEGPAPLTREQVRQYIDPELHREVGTMFDDSVDGAVGRGRAFDEVHNAGLKESDVANSMAKDAVQADPFAMRDWAGEVKDSLEQVADELEGSGYKAHAKRARAQAAALDDAIATSGIDDVAEEGVSKAGGVGYAELARLASAGDVAKRWVDDAISDFGRAGTTDVSARAVAKRLTELNEPIRKALEREDLFGSSWAKRQTGDNRMWSGDKGLIVSGNRWQDGLVERDPRGYIRVGDREYAAWQSKPGAFENTVLKEPDKAFQRRYEAFQDWQKAQNEKIINMLEGGAQSAERGRVVELQQYVDRMSTAFDEAARIRDAVFNRAPVKVQTAAGKALGLAEELPGVGGVLKKGRKLAEEATGTTFGEAEVIPDAPVRRSGEEAYKAARGRQRGTAESPYVAPEGKPPETYVAPPQTADVADYQKARNTRGSASVGAMGAAAGLGIAGLAAAPWATQQLSEMSKDNAAIRERAALGLVAPATRAKPLPNLLSRFKGDARSIGDAFQLKIDDLQQALNDPMALIDGMTQAYGAIADDHSELFGELVARTNAAAHYVLENAPPSVGISLARPTGIAPDAIAVAQFAAIWIGAFNPGDVIYDVGTGHATPTQIKALREVHPDVYDALRIDVMQQVDGEGAAIPFETLRKLDVLFDLPGVAGPAFGPSMTKTMAKAYETAPQQSKAPMDPTTAPASATAKFAGGPSNLAAMGP